MARLVELPVGQELNVETMRSPVTTLSQDQQDEEDIPTVQSNDPRRSVHEVVGDDRQEQQEQQEQQEIVQTETDATEQGRVSCDQELWSNSDRYAEPVPGAHDVESLETSAIPRNNHLYFSPVSLSDSKEEEDGDFGKVPSPSSSLPESAASTPPQHSSSSSKVPSSSALKSSPSTEQGYTYWYYTSRGKKTSSYVRQEPTSSGASTSSGRRGDDGASVLPTPLKSDRSTVYTTASLSFEGTGRKRPASHRTATIKTPWILILCFFMFVAAVGVGLWSYKRISDLDEEVTVYESKVTLLDSDSSNWEQQALTAQGRVQELEEQVHSLEGKVESLQAQVEALQTNVTQQEDENEAWKEQNDQLETTLADTLTNLTSQLQGLAFDNWNCESLKDNLTDVQATLLQEIVDFRQVIDQLSLHNAELNDLTQSLSTEKDFLNQQTIPSLNTRIGTLEDELATTLEDKAMLTTNLTETMMTVADMKQTITTLETDNSTCHANHSVCQEDKVTLASMIDDLDSNLTTCQTDYAQLQSNFANMSNLYTRCDSERSTLQLITIPGMESEINRLTFQVDQLTMRASFLEQENDRYILLNGQLNETIRGYENLTDQLNETIDDLSEEVNTLNSTVENLEDVRNNLTAEVNQYQVLTNDLNATKNELTQEVANLTNIVDSLEILNNALNVQVQNLSGQVGQLQGIKMDLEDQVVMLHNETQNLTDQVDRLSVLLDEFQTVSSYINSTSTSLGDPFDSILDRLSNEIKLNRAIAIDVLRNHYADATDFWDCAVADLFGGEPWLSDRNMPIGNGTVELVIDEVQQKVLDVMCLNRGDFVQYLMNSFDTQGSNDLASFLTFNELRQGTALYSYYARSYYFPLTGQPGLTDEQWEAAEYSCPNVPPFLINT